MEKLLIYSTAAMLLIITGIICCYKKNLTQELKDRILKILAISTVVIHYSSLYVSFFTTGSIEIDSTMILPIYPCNICMWLLLIVSFIKNKNQIFCKISIEFLAVAGTVCGLIGLFANENFLANPSFLDYSSLKGLLSHTTMIAGTLFLFTQGYMRLDTISLTISTACGLLLFIVLGFILNMLYDIFKLDPVNIMFMREFPLDIPGFNFLTLGIAGLIVVFIFGHIYELIMYHKDERWYNNFSFKNKKN